MELVEGGNKGWGWSKVFDCTGVGVDNKGCGIPLRVYEHDIFVFVDGKRPVFGFACMKCRKVTVIPSLPNGIRARGRKPPNELIRLEPHQVVSAPVIRLTKQVTGT